MCTIAGDINLKVPTSLQTELDLKADSVTVDKQLDTTSLICTKSDAQEHVTGMIQCLCVTGRFFQVNCC